MRSCLSSFFSSLGTVDKWGGERLSSAWVGKQLEGGGAPSRPMGQRPMSPAQSFLHCGWRSPSELISLHHTHCPPFFLPPGCVALGTRPEKAGLLLLSLTQFLRSKGLGTLRLSSIVERALELVSASLDSGPSPGTV